MFVSGAQRSAKFIKTDIHLSGVNQYAVKLARNSIFHAKTKQIVLKHQFIRGHILEGEIALDYIHTINNPADFSVNRCLAPSLKSTDMLWGLDLCKN